MKTAAFGSEDSIGQKPTSRGPVIRCAKSSRVREVYSDRLQLDFQSNYKRRRPLRRGLIRSGWLTDGELESKHNRNDTEPGNPQQTERTLKTGNRSRRACDSWWYITLTCNVRVVKRTSSRRQRRQVARFIAPRTINKDYRRLVKKDWERLLWEKIWWCWQMSETFCIAC